MTAEVLSAVSPLAEWSPAFSALPPSVRVREVPFTGQLDVRCDEGAPAFAALGEALGAALPTTPCTCAEFGTVRALWLGPDEWLVLTRPDERAAVEASLRAAGGSVTDVSAHRTVVRLEGAAAREVLASGCAIDLHPSVSPGGTCVQTLIDQCGVIVVVDDDTATAFTLLVRSSFAPYLAAWLVDACADLAH